MKKYIVIGNPIEHSLSPKLHNHWIKKNNIDAIYDKKLLNEDGIENIIFQVKKGEIDGINVTVPFKKSVIPFLDELSAGANESQSVNTIYKENDKVKFRVNPRERYIQKNFSRSVQTLTGSFIPEGISEFEAKCHISSN